MAFYNQVSVGTSATLIIAANNNRKGIVLVNYGNAVLYIGPDDQITTANAIPLLPRAFLESTGLAAGWRGSIYGLAESGTIDVRYWEWNQ